MPHSCKLEGGLWTASGLLRGRQHGGYLSLCYNAWFLNCRRNLLISGRIVLDHQGTHGIYQRRLFCLVLLSLLSRTSTGLYKVYSDLFPEVLLALWPRSDQAVFKKRKQVFPDARRANQLA